MDAPADPDQQFARGPLQNFHDASLGNVLFARRIDHGHDLVAGPGSAKIARVDEKILLALGFRDEIAHAGAAHVQGAGHARQTVHESVAFAHLRDFPAFDHLGQGGFDDFLEGGVGVEQAVDILAAHGSAGLAQGGQKTFFGKFCFSLFFRGHVTSRVGCESERPASLERKQARRSKRKSSGAASRAVRRRRGPA